jgi:hypothetical protein
VIAGFFHHHTGYFLLRCCNFFTHLNSYIVDDNNLIDEVSGVEKNIFKREMQLASLLKIKGGREKLSEVQQRRQ